MGSTVLIVVLGLAAVSLAVTLIRLYLKHRALARKYAPIADIERAFEERRAAIQQIEAQHAVAAQQHQQRMAAAEHEVRQRSEGLTLECQVTESTLAKLRDELAAVEESVEAVDIGLYKPHFNFDTSERYRAELEKVYEKMKALVKEGRAAWSAVEWSVDGDKRKGARMQKQQTQLMLRAFNGECDAAVAKVSWNNVSRMEERIRKAYEAVNKMGEVMTCTIGRDYLDLRLAELRLAHEYEEKKRAEAEEQRRIKEQMREEEKAQRELDKAREQAEAEEERFEKALEKARAEVAQAKGKQVAELGDRIQLLEAQLAEAHQKKERAKSMAEMTRSGYVYILSNLGSFGPNVYKIGMTRRLDPMDRVKELGDASVPFTFDVHAMVYSADAPGLENTLHRKFDARRLNLVNLKKEFFNVTLDEIEAFARELNTTVDITKLAEAREYRETVAQRKQMQQSGRAPAMASA